MTFEEYVLQLRHGEISFDDVPDEVRKDYNFVKCLRKNKFMKTKNKGYDIIRDCFFSNEIYYIKSRYSDDVHEVEREHCFDSFLDLYSFLNGQRIYTNACYYQLTEERLNLCDFDASSRKKI